jgi:replicative DNA helicase
VSHELEHLNFFIDDTPALSIAALRTRARRLKRTHGLGLLIIDYLQLLAPSGKTRQENRVQEVSEITRGLKTLAKELDVPVLALSQLSRAVEQREDKRPQLADLRNRDRSSRTPTSSCSSIATSTISSARPKRRTDESDQRYNERHDAWKQRCGQMYGKAEVTWPSSAMVDRHRPAAFEGQFTKFGNWRPTTNCRPAHLLGRIDGSPRPTTRRDAPARPDDRSRGHRRQLARLRDAARHWLQVDAPPS